MTWLSERNEAASAAVAAYLQRTYGETKSLAKVELLASGLDVETVGWSFRVAQHHFALGVNATFPYSVPRIALLERPELSLSPHFERHSRLCLVGDEARVDSSRPEAVVEALIQEADALLASNAVGQNDDDLVVDFRAYWERSADSSVAVRAYVERRGPTREVACWLGEHFQLVAESVELADRWMTNRYGPDKPRKFKPTALIWLDPLPRPAEYPNSLLALRELISADSADDLALLDRIVAAENSTSHPILIAGPSGDGSVGFGAIQVRQGSTGGYSGKRPALSRGFRPGHLPPSVAAARKRSARAPVELVDGAVTRLPIAIRGQLESKRVTVVGCGSLGAGVARLLAQSGVGHLTLIDPDILRWENIGRHELGADFVNLNKATSLAKVLRTTLPHIASVTAYHVGLFDVADLEDLLPAQDLVLSATGDWNCESGLDDFMRTVAADVPRLYTWLERNAAVGHSVLLTGSAPCLRCGFTDVGTPLNPTTSWLVPQLAEQCGTATSPYSSLDMIPTQAITANLAVDALLGTATGPLHRLWLARTSSLEAQGGYWSSQWTAKHDDPGLGGTITAVPWKRRLGCICNG